MFDRSQTERRSSAKTLSWVIVGVIVLFTVVAAGFVIWAYTPDGHARRQSDIRAACAAGLASPKECADEGVQMEWKVVG